MLNMNFPSSPLTSGILYQTALPEFYVDSIPVPEDEIVTRLHAEWAIFLREDG